MRTQATPRRTAARVVASSTARDRNDDQQPDVEVGIPPGTPVDVGGHRRPAHVDPREVIGAKQHQGLDPEHPYRRQDAESSPEALPP